MTHILVLALFLSPVLSQDPQSQEMSVLPQSILTLIGICVVVQAVVGIIAVEYAWAKTKKFREVNEKRDA
jgi:hypothetical protein